MSFILLRFMILMATFWPVGWWTASFTLLKAPIPSVFFKLYLYSAQNADVNDRRDDPLFIIPSPDMVMVPIGSQADDPTKLLEYICNKLDPRTDDGGSWEIEEKKRQVTNRLLLHLSFCGRINFGSTSFWLPFPKKNLRVVAAAEPSSFSDIFKQHHASWTLVLPNPYARSALRSFRWAVVDMVKLKSPHRHANKETLDHVTPNTSYPTLKIPPLLILWEENKSRHPKLRNGLFERNLLSPPARRSDPQYNQLSQHLGHTQIPLPRP